MIRRLLSAWVALIALIWLGTGHAQFNGCPTGFCSTRAPAGGGGSLAFCAIGPENAGAGLGNYFASSASFSITANINAGTCTPNPGAVCVVQRHTASLSPSAGAAMTWNAVSMTLITSATGGTDYAALFALHNPATGSQTVAFSATNAAVDNFMNCIWFSNVNQTNDATAFPHFTTNTSVSSVTVTSASGHIGVGSYTSGGSALGTALGTAIYANSVSGSAINAGSDYVTSSGATVVVGVTGGTESAIVGVDVSN